MQQCPKNCGTLWPDTFNHPWKSEHHQKSCSPKSTPICEYIIDGIWCMNFFMLFLIGWGLIL